MDTAEAGTKMVEDLLAQEQAGLKKKLEDGEDTLEDAAMFRVWSYNPNIDLSFLEGEQETTLARWKTRLKKELWTQTEVVARDDLRDEASSRPEGLGGEPQSETHPGMFTPITPNPPSIS